MALNASRKLKAQGMTTYETKNEGMFAEVENSWSVIIRGFASKTVIAVPSVIRKKALV